MQACHLKRLSLGPHCFLSAGPRACSKSRRPSPRTCNGRKNRAILTEALRSLVHVHHLHHSRAAAATKKTTNTTKTMTRKTTMITTTTTSIQLRSKYNLQVCLQLETQGVTEAPGERLQDVLGLDLHRRPKRVHIGLRVPVRGACISFIAGPLSCFGGPSRHSPAAARFQNCALSGPPRHPSAG